MVWIEADLTMVGGGLWLLFSVEGIAVDSSLDSAWLMYDSRVIASLEAMVGRFVGDSFICLSSEAAGVRFDAGS
jgi:hypothetical protein